MLSKTNYSNIPQSIGDKLSRKLHNQKNHPIEIIKNHIYGYFSNLTNYKFETFDDLNPFVSIKDNFDNLLIPIEHPARSKSDTYYLNENYVLRTHTSAHQNELLDKGLKSFLVTGDVYRKDEIDACHYPIFHQMEMLTLLQDNVNAEDELKSLLAGLVEYLFPHCEYRFNDDYFPFTNPSFEIEVKYNDKWMEILGCGVVQPKILENNGIFDQKAIACGFGLDRLVMIFCNIPDIRYLWSTHEKFLNQYADGKLNIFQPYSILPSQTRDISFYVLNSNGDKWLDKNDFFEIVRDNTNDMMDKIMLIQSGISNKSDILEEVKLIDSFYNKKLDKYSRTYRLTYSSNDPDLKDGGEFFDMVNKIQNTLRDKLANSMKIELR